MTNQPDELRSRRALAIPIVIYVESDGTEPDSLAFQDATEVDPVFVTNPVMSRAMMRIVTSLFESDPPAALRLTDVAGQAVKYFAWSQEDRQAQAAWLVDALQESLERDWRSDAPEKDPLYGLNERLTAPDKRLSLVPADVHAGEEGSTVLDREPTPDDVSEEEAEQAARDYVFPPLRVVAQTALLEGENKFWDLMREFGEQPLLQDLVQAWYGRTGRPERPDPKGERMIRLVLAMSDLLEAAADHETRDFDLEEDSELAYIVFGALNPDSSIHNKAMRDFDTWQARHNARKIEDLKENVAPGWVRSRREAEAKREANQVDDDHRADAAEDSSRAC
jgi:hypothetical protein